MKFHAEDLHRTCCRYFQTNLLFWWSIFDDINNHKTAIYRKTLTYTFLAIMITYPISSNLCKKISLQCYWLYDFPSFRSSHWRYSVTKGVLRNFAEISQENTYGKVSFLINLQAEATASDLSLVYFISTEKWNEKREMPCWSSSIYFFFSSIDLFHVKDFKRNLTDRNLFRKCV